LNNAPGRLTKLGSEAGTSARTRSFLAGKAAEAIDSAGALVAGRAPVHPVGVFPGIGFGVRKIGEEATGAGTLGTIGRLSDFLQGE